MRVLLDESLPQALKDLLVGHEAQTVAGAGWNGITNGRLLALAATQLSVSEILWARRLKNFHS
jgi:hypothetical protein